MRNTFQNQPWIEITKLKPIKRRVNTAALSHLYRGETHMKKRRWSKAISELSLAPGADLPKHVLGVIHKNLAVCYLRLGESTTAVQHINTAVGLLKTVDSETREMAKLATTHPGRFLDRAVGNIQVGDHERPMWEAFDGDIKETPVQSRTTQPAVPQRGAMPQGRR